MLNSKAWVSLKKFFIACTISGVACILANFFYEQQIHQFSLGIRNYVSSILFGLLSSVALFVSTAIDHTRSHAVPLKSGSPLLDKDTLFSCLHLFYKVL